MGQFGEFEGVVGVETIKVRLRVVAPQESRLGRII